MEKGNSQWYLLRVVGGKEEKKITEIKAVLTKNNLLSDLEDIQFFGQIKPEFKGLLFCKCRMSRLLMRSVFKIKGVAGFIKTQEEEFPSPVTPAAMRRIFASLEEESLPRYQAYSEKTPVKIGELVKISQGKFANYEGRIESYDPKREKVKLILEKLGWELTDVPLADCEKVL